METQTVKLTSQTGNVYEADASILKGSKYIEDIIVESGADDDGAIPLPLVADRELVRVRAAILSLFY
jgi:hypothetical protein